MLSLLGISAVNPALLWGALAVASPILIHLLSKRRFRVVDWAAMDFLFDADKRNRRRVRLENLVLLLLRCLAVALIALLVARPVLAPTGMASAMIQAGGVERVVLLDDSPSTQVSAGKGTTFDEAKAALIDFVRGMNAGDTLTLLVTSQPDSPLLNGQYLSGDKVDDVVEVIGELQPVDVSADLDKALLEVEKLLASPSGNVNRVVYLLSDLRRRDWIPAQDVPPDKSVSAIVRRLASKAQGCFLVDIGSDAVQNLTVADLAPLDKTLVAGVGARFQVTVANAGTADAEDVEVRFEPGGLTGTIERIAAGTSEAIPFTYTFRETGEAQVRAEIGADVLAVDNQRHFAARISDGVQVLVVDGDPSSEPRRSESHYLSHALAPPGKVLSGNAVEIVTENQFEALPLGKYQIIYLANLYRISEDRVEALEAWVKAGGGLVLALGDQVDVESYNDRLYRRGQGLMPLELTDIEGDESEKRWVNFTIEKPNHAVLGMFEGAQAPLIKAIHVFRWWASKVPEPEAGGGVSVVSRFTDPESSPAVVEKGFGQGRVLAITTAMDEDWSDWPVDPTYFVTLQLMNSYLARQAVGEGNVLAGMPLRHELDPSRFYADVKVKAPHQEPVSVGALAPEGPTTGEVKNLVVEYDGTKHAGVYTMELSRRDGDRQEVTFAVNLDAGEGQLQQVDDTQLGRLLGDTSVVINRGKGRLSLDASGSKAELWRPTLLLLGAVLGMEQFLAWLFGKKR